MRKKSKHILSVFVLVLAFLAFAPSANAETTGCLTVSGTQAALKLTLLEGKTETITSLRLKINGDNDKWNNAGACLSV